MEDKERGYSLIGFVAWCQSQSLWLLNMPNGAPHGTPLWSWPLVGARVASQHCPILRPGRFHLRPDLKGELETACSIASNGVENTCPERRHPLAGFELIIIGRF